MSSLSTTPSRTNPGNTPNAGKFYDHTISGYIWGQNLIYALYADEKTTYPLGFRLYEKDAKRRVENLLFWALNSPNRRTDELMQEIEGIFV